MVSLEIFDQMEVESILAWKKKKKQGKERGRGRGLGISCFIKDIDYNGVS